MEFRIEARITYCICALGGFLLAYLPLWLKSEYPILLSILGLAIFFIFILMMIFTDKEIRKIKVKVR